MNERAKDGRSATNGSLNGHREDRDGDGNGPAGSRPFRSLVLFPPLAHFLGFS